LLTSVNSTRPPESAVWLRIDGCPGSTVIAFPPSSRRGKIAGIGRMLRPDPRIPFRRILRWLSLNGLGAHSYRSL
jgi:hypothetical protein